MADLEKVVKIILAGEDRLSKTLNSVGKGIDKFGGKVESATQPLADLTDKIIAIDAVIAAMAAGALALAVKNAGEFADSFSEVATLIDAPAEKINDFKKDVLDYSRGSVTALEGITTATYNIISATGDWENSLALLTETERLNVAGKGELEDTTKLLVSSLNAYGKGVEEAADFSDVLFTGVRVGQTTLTELSASLGTITGLASSASVPFDDLTAAVAGLTGTLGNTSLAVTQVKGILAAVIKPSEAAKKAAGELGLAFDSQTLAAKGLQPFLRMVYDAADGNTDIMAKLFGRVEALNGALILGADTSGKYGDALLGMENRAGATTVAYEKMAENFGLTNQRLINNLKATLIDFGMPYLDEWGLIANALGDVFQGVSVGIDEGAFDPVVEFVENFGTNIATLLEGIAEAMPEALENIDWEGLLKSLKGLGDALGDLFSDFFGDVDLTNAKDLTRVVQLIVEGFETLAKVSTGIAEGLGPFIAKLGDMVDGFNGLDESTKETVGNILGIGKAINSLTGAIPLLTMPINILSGAIGLLSLTRMPALFGSIGKLITAIGAGVGGGLVAALGAATAAFALIPGTAPRELAEDIIPGWKKLAETMDSVVLGYMGLDIEAVKAMESQAANTKALGDARVEMVKMLEAADKLPSQVGTEVLIEGTEEYQTALDGLIKEIRALPDEKETVVGAEVDKPSFAKAKEYIVETGEDGITTIVFAKANEPSIKETIAAVEKIPTERQVEIQLQGDIDVQLAQIEAQAETLQAMFEWEAKLEIAEIEAGVDRLEIVAGNVNDMFVNTGDVLSNMFGALSGASSWEALQILDAIEEESRRREELLLLQKDLTQAEIDLTKARTKRLEKGGQGLISISASGVYPELELVLQSIIERAQIQANAEGMEFLLGGS